MQDNIEKNKAGYLDILWYVLVALFLFCAGVTYQWYVSKNPVYPLTVFGTVLDSSKEQLADTLEQVGLKRPHYYYETDFEAADNHYDATKAQHGLTLITAVDENQTLEVEIVELDGTQVQHWPVDWFSLWPDAEHVPDIFEPKQRPGTHIHGAVIMDNGDLVFNFEYQGLVRLDVCGDVVWRLPYLTHHSIDRDETTGNLWVSGKIFHEEPTARYPNHVPPFAEPTVLEVSPAGKIISEMSVLEILEKNDLHGLMYMDGFGKIQAGSGKTTGDTLHLNDVEVFPPHLKRGTFEPGDLMLSLRNIHTVLVVDPRTEEIVYKQAGGFVGQHDPDFIDGNRISVFDNAVAVGDDAPRESRVVILDADDPVSEPEVYFEGSEEMPFYTDVMGKHQWLQNGNLLITESTRGHAFELDPKSDIVWEHVNLVDQEGLVGLVGEAQRLPPDYDRQFFEAQRSQRCGREDRLAVRADPAS